MTVLERIDQRNESGDFWVVPIMQNVAAQASKPDSPFIPTPARMDGYREVFLRPSFTRDPLHLAEATRLLTDRENPFWPDTRRDLYREVVHRKCINWYRKWKEREDTTYNALLHEAIPARFSPAINYWERLAYGMLAAESRGLKSDKESVIEQGVRLDDFLNLSTLIIGSKERAQLVQRAIEDGLGLVKKVNDRMVFPNPYVLFYLTSAYLLSSKEHFETNEASLVPDLSYRRTGPRETVRLINLSYLKSVTEENGPYHFPGCDELFRRLENIRIFENGNYNRYFLLLSFLGEEMLRMDDERIFSDYILGVSERAGESEGLNLAVRLMNNIYYNTGIRECIPNSRPRIAKVIYSCILALKQKMNWEKETDYKLDEIERDLWRKNLQILYPLRPAVISQEVLDRALTKGDLFSQEIFESEIKETMRILFGGSKQRNFQAVYEAAMRENMMKPVTLLIMAHMFGLDPVKARILAATNFMGWMAVKGLDMAGDGELVRKQVETQLAKEGVGEVLDTSLLAFVDILDKNLADPVLSRKYIEMLKISAEGNRASRRLNWDSSIKEHLKVANAINNSLTWFTVHFGDESGFKLAGQHFSEFYSKLICLSQLLTDINDVMPEVISEEAGRDFGSKLTLPLKLFAELSPDELPVNLRQRLSGDIKFIKNYFESERLRKIPYPIPAEGKALTDLNKAIRTLQKYRVYVVRKMFKDLSLPDIYNQASEALQKGINSLPDDVINQQYGVILQSILKSFWRQFCNLGGIDA